MESSSITAQLKRTSTRSSAWAFSLSILANLSLPVRRWWLAPSCRRNAVGRHSYSWRPFGRATNRLCRTGYQSSRTTLVICFLPFRRGQRERQQRVESGCSDDDEAAVQGHQTLKGALPPRCRPTPVDRRMAGLAKHPPPGSSNCCAAQNFRCQTPIIAAASFLNAILGFPHGN